MDISVKERILLEANRVISKKGLNCFTLEEVAREAGVSKGGLLYHYRSKDELIKGLIEHYIKELDNSTSDWFTSFICNHVDCVSSDSNNMAGLLAAIAMNQELLEPVIEKRREWYKDISNLKDPVLGMIVSLACYGMAFSKLLGLEVFTEDDLRSIQERLISMSKDCY